MSPDPIATALFLVVSFVLAGCAQTAWLRSAVSRKLALPLDFGKSFRGRRILGDHKTLRGFVVMVPAAALSFALVHPLVPGIWNLGSSRYLALGALAGLGFMAGELPNSFLKRQLGIAPGESRAFSFVLDRIDSILGMLLVVSLAVPTPWETWALVLTVGPVLHLLFSSALFLLDVKARWA
jgi:CDP-2,3-bis-(O-geranylgeranyl)-sn-glycerol synthase